MYPDHIPMLYRETVPNPRLLLSIETDLSHFRSRRRLLCNRELRSITRPFSSKRYHPYEDIPAIDPARAATPGPSQPLIVQPEDDIAEGETGDISKLPDLDEDGLIPKPSGEVGRRKRGYSLKQILGWDDVKFKAVKDKVNADVAQYLNHSLSVAKQPPGCVEKLTKIVSCSYDCITRFSNPLDRREVSRDGKVPGRLAYCGFDFTPTQVYSDPQG